jgi:predicted Rossmann-fold nucleotide-binding protein
MKSFEDASGAFPPNVASSSEGFVGSKYPGPCTSVVSDEAKRAVAFLTLAQSQDTPVPSLRVCCYGSSSSRTPGKYLDAAYQVGYFLGARGHTCVNGAGSCGCMAAMNEGAADANGHIVGVIHAMWLIENPSSAASEPSIRMASNIRDGGAHAVFDQSKSNCSSEPLITSLSLPVASKRKQPIREMIVAGGSDLQERKRLLVENADALIVLPGGPGTWDEVSIEHASGHTFVQT